LGPHSTTELFEMTGGLSLEFHAAMQMSNKEFVLSGYSMLCCRADVTTVLFISPWDGESQVRYGLSNL